MSASLPSRLFASAILAGAYWFVQRVMHAGDIFAAIAQPTIDTRNGGNGMAYGETIARAVARIKNVDKGVTGHSDVMTWQDFVNYGEFNRLFLQVARDSLKAGNFPELYAELQQ